MVVERVQVSTMGEVGAARRLAEDIARRIGFDAQEAAEVALATTELASNLVVHKTLDGLVSISEVSDPLGKGIEIVAQDRGPGISDLKYALRDSASSAGSMGCGLGAVNRLMDEFDIYSDATAENASKWHSPERSRGTVVSARKWIVDRRAESPLVYSVNSRPFPGLTANGDSYYVHRERDGLLVAVADGLGHGPDAERASQRAVRFIESNHSKPLDELLTEVHEELRGTRGAAITLVRIRLSDESLLHVGVGNVEARLYPRSSMSLIPLPGVVGAGRLPRPKVTEIPWPSDGTLVLYSDGVSAKWDLSAEAKTLECHVTTLTHLLMQQHGRPNDDATLVAVRGTLA